MPTPTELDPRIISVSIEVNGQLKTYSSPMFIEASGTKYANALQNEASVIIANLDRETQDYLLTETTPFNLNRTPKTITISAGRKSYGTAVIYVGNIITAMVSQPPDVGVTLKCLTGNFIKGNVLSRNQPGSAQLLQISRQIAQDTGTILNFQATNRNISNYAYSGPAGGQVTLLNTMGGLNAFIDDGTLVVKNAGAPITINSSSVKVVSSQTGMVEIPVFTEQGIKVKFLLDNRTTLGGLIRVISTQYPAANGDYVIYKLGFQIATRNTPFYYVAEAARLPRTV